MADGMRYGGLIDRLVRRIAWDPASGDADAVIRREWIVTNGLGGYASGTVGGLNTRRYHGTLVAALPNPLGRIVMLNRVQECVFVGDRVVRLDAEERTDGLHAQAVAHLAEFRLEAGLPVWRYVVGPVQIEKRLLMVYGQNTVQVRYMLVGGDAPVRLELAPAVHFRSYEGSVGSALHDRHFMADEGDHITIAADRTMPCLRMNVYGQDSTFELRRRRIDGIVYSLERARGYDFEGALWSPGHFRVMLTRERAVALVASAESWDIASVMPAEDAPQIERERRRRLLALAPVTSTHDIAAELVLAADQFLITPAGRHAEATRARAVGDEVRTVIAGYHWFTDWGRDTMISLEGLTLVTGRHREAGFILRTFARYVRDGLIPNMFPDGSNEGLYHTADATMWFFHAVDRYLQTTGDRDTLLLVLPVLRSIIQAHVAGTRFGIGMDARDGLLREGAEGYQLTWMDAKVEDWVVTPRRGKPVEINALWYNALCLFAGWLEDFGHADEAREITERAQQVRHSFNARFWYEQGGYLFDVVDGPEGDSTEFRPNQLFAFSLRYPVLDPARWKPVLDQVRERLLTPVGLRSLAPGSAGYRAKYDGDLRARDAAYHQGTVWGWLVGAWIDAYVRVHPEDRAGARRFLDGMIGALSTFGVGTIAEIFDAEEPYTPRGCIAQAWSVAETLRCLAKVQA